VTELEWETQYGQWLEPVRAPNGTHRVKLSRVHEPLATRRGPRGVVDILLGVASLIVAVAGGPWFPLFYLRSPSQLECDRVIAQFLVDATEAERTIARAPEPEASAERYRSVRPSTPAGELLPWYRRPFWRRRAAASQPSSSLAS
jgi:hypothetical protein